jgi:serine/threonine-protein kinase RIO1
MALDFLRRDCAVMNNFFRKNHVYVLTTLKLFNFITDFEIKDSQAEAALSVLMQEALLGYSPEVM